VNEAHDDPLALAYAGHYLAYVHNRHTDGMTALSGPSGSTRTPGRS
jgi:hypothetical protein